MKNNVSQYLFNLFSMLSVHESFLFTKGRSDKHDHFKKILTYFSTILKYSPFAWIHCFCKQVKKAVDVDHNL